MDVTTTSPRGSSNSNLHNNANTSSSNNNNGCGSSSSSATSHTAHTRDIVVPRLDEEMLSTSGNFAVVGQDSLPATQLAPMTYMYDALSPVHAADPSAVTLALLQQQQQQQQQQVVVAAAAAQLEQDYLQTRAMLQRCSRNALLMILTSLIDEFPTTMVGLVRLRLEQIMATRAAAAAAAAAAQQQGLPSPGTPLSTSRTPNTAARLQQAGMSGVSTFVPNSAAAPWTPSSQLSYLTATSMSGGGVGAGGGVSGLSSSSVGALSMATTTTTTPMATAGGGATGSTPYSSSPLHRKGRGHKSKDEEQEMCSVHNCLRSTKHLQLNSTTGKYECVHGFHCLVDSPLVATTTAQQQQQQQQQSQLRRDTHGSGSYEATTSNGRAAAVATTTPSATSSSSGGSGLRGYNATTSIGSGSRHIGTHVDGDDVDAVQSKTTSISQFVQQQQQQQQQQSTTLYHDAANGFDALHNNTHTTYETTSPSDEVLKLDMLSLENLLQSMRDFDKDDGAV